MYENRYTSDFFQAVHCELSALLEPEVYGAFVSRLDRYLASPRCQLDSFAEDWFRWVFSDPLGLKMVCGEDSLRVVGGLFDDLTPRGSVLWGAAVLYIKSMEDDSCTNCARLVATAMADDGPEGFGTTLAAVRAICDLIEPDVMAQSILFQLAGDDF